MIRIVFLAALLALLAFPPPVPAQVSAAPPNDLPPGAVVVPADTFAFAEPTTTARHAGELRPCGSIGNTVWFAYTPRASRWMRALTHGSNFDTVLAVYASTQLGLVPFACNDDASGGLTPVTSRVTWWADASTTYYIQAGGYDGRNGVLVLRLEPAPASAASESEEPRLV